jgi:uncharacterized repeat protein (TIGR01451 family)/gliding motility-associated-like protein
VRPILLALNKTSDVTEIPVGGMVNYTITLTNNSAFALTDVLVTDPLPAGLMNMGAEPAQDPAGSWTISEILPGESQNLQLQAMGVELGEKINTANVTIGDYSDLVVSPPVNVVPKSVSIAVSKTSFGEAIYEDNEFEYEIRVTNTGQTSAENILVSDQLPGNVEFIGFSGTDPGATLSGSTLSWTVSSLAAGQEMVYVIRVQAIGIGTVTNSVSVTLPEDQSNTSASSEDSDTNQIIRFFVPNVITPGNTDGKNDTFEIRGIQNFANSSLTILNRNGDHVFESDNYMNDWAAQGLNSGAYFYVLKITDNSGDVKTFKGWVQVIK